MTINILQLSYELLVIQNLLIKNGTAVIQGVYYFKELHVININVYKYYLLYFREHSHTHIYVVNLLLHILYLSPNYFIYIWDHRTVHYIICVF